MIASEFEKELHGRVGVVIVAAGSGSRFGEERPKQYEDLNGIPVFLHSVRLFDALEPIDDIVIVVRSGDERKVQAILEQANLDQPTLEQANLAQANRAGRIQVVVGGPTRADSVAEGLHALDTHGMKYVLVHDAVRALITREVVLRVIEATKKFGAAIAAMPVVDTLKRVHVGTIECTVSRNDLWRAQTPQGATLETLKLAYDHARKQRYVATDEAELLERMGVTVQIVEGDENNFKITYPADLERARILLAREQHKKRTD